MRFQQLRTLAILVGVLIHRSITARFECSNDGPDQQPLCWGTIHGEDFEFTSKTGCTQAGYYCATITGTNENYWTLSIENYDGCDPSYPCTPPACTLQCQCYSDLNDGTSCDVDGCNADAIPKEPFEKEKGRIPNMDISTRQHQNIHPASYIVEPTRKHTCTFILLHGLGSTGEKFGVELLDTARSSKGHKLIEIFPGARFIFPTAKKRRSSAFNRALITQWFDIASLDDPSHKMERQVEGLSDSAAYLFDILKKEIEIVAPENIILGGISHGCAMSLSLLLCLEHPLGGFIGMSGWLPYQKDLEEIMQVKDDIGDDIFGSDEEPVEQSPILKVVEFVRELLTVEAKNASLTNTSLSTPVFIGHGETDEKVKHILGQDISRTLKLLGMDVTWKLYPGHGHWYKTPEEIDDILSFLRTNVGLDINSNSRSS